MNEKDKLVSVLTAVRSNGWKRQDIKDIVDEVCNKIPLRREKI